MKNKYVMVTGCGIDIAGQRFGRLVALGCTSRSRGSVSLPWHCKCDCGAETIVSGASLRGGHTKSCGCLQKEKAAENCIKRRRTHGLSNSSEHWIWDKIKWRCNNEKCPQYPRYGGRGIRMCQGWSDSFASFIDDIGRRPSKKHSIDRIDNNGSYSCGHCDECLAKGWIMNCRWATAEQQATNRRNVILISRGGREMSLKAWCRELGVPYLLTYRRIKENGWDVERALTTPKVDRSRSSNREPDKISRKHGSTN